MHDEAPSSGSDTRPVRESEALDWASLDSYLRAHLDLPSEPLEVAQFPGGHSNLTYLLRAGSKELVLRRPPFGPVATRAHDIAREYRVLEAIHPALELAPAPILLCEDAAVIGSTFYVMERRRGIVLRHSEPVGIADAPDARRRLSGVVVDTLARLHALDVTSGAIARIGHPTGFVDRQIRGWTDRWRASQIDDVPDMDAVAAWLADRIPPETGHATVVHGDFKLDNIMLDGGDPTRVVAIFDWEMAALGDPLVDLGILLCYWVHAAAVLEHESLATITRSDGWFRRDEILEHYERRTGASLERIGFYEVFALFKLTVVLQQIFARYRRGQTDDPRFAGLGTHVNELARLAATMAGGSS